MPQHRDRGLHEMPDGQYLSQNDTIMWMVEADPLLRSTIMGVVLLDGAPDWDRLQARVEEVSHHIAALREKVVSVPLHPTTLRWVDDPDVDPKVMEVLQRFQMGVPTASAPQGQMAVAYTIYDADGAVMGQQIRPLDSPRIELPADSLSKDIRVDAQIVNAEGTALTAPQSALLAVAAVAMPVVIKREAVVQLLPWVEKGKKAAETVGVLYYK